MEFKISAGAGKRNGCPKCGKKLLAILTKGDRKEICSCGFSRVLKTYAKNAVDTKIIPTS